MSILDDIIAWESQSESASQRGSISRLRKDVFCLQKEGYCTQEISKLLDEKIEVVEEAMEFIKYNDPMRDMCIDPNVNFVDSQGIDWSYQAWQHVEEGAEIKLDHHIKSLLNNGFTQEQIDELLEVHK